MPDMLVKLYDLPEVESLINRLKAQGIVIRTAMPYEKHIIIEWVWSLFGEGWASECDIAFSNHPVSCLIATQAGKIIGFACHDSTCKNFFGPIGVIETKRSQQIGKALLLSCLHAMSANGYGYAIIGGSGPTDFYAKAAGAITIEGSSPGIYRDRLTQKISNKPPMFGEQQNL
ncbi:MAG: GNAT family N-acetyltransferase [Desulfobacteraceae bacterium]|nr:GNAT family N-acetyltransferase [Desulfobacteraceae bacterium]